MEASRKYQDSLVNALREPQEAAAYLDAALEAGDRAAFLLAMRNVINAMGGMTQMASVTGLNRENLYRALSERGNPELASLEKLLKGLGLRLSIELDNNLRDAEGRLPAFLATLDSQNEIIQEIDENLIPLDDVTI